MTVVRPFRARIVSQDWSAARGRPDVRLRSTTPFPDLRSGVVDPEAYDESPAALYVYRQRRGPTRTSASSVTSTRGLRRRTGPRARVGPPAAGRGAGTALRDPPDRPALVALLHRTGPAFTRSVAETCLTAPLLHFTAPDGIEQTVWRLADGPDTDALSDELSGARHYIADGHHRVAASLEGGSRPGTRPDAGAVVRRLPDRRPAPVGLPPPGHRPGGPARPAGPALAMEFDVRTPQRHPALATGPLRGLRRSAPGSPPPFRGDAPRRGLGTRRLGPARRGHRRAGPRRRAPCRTSSSPRPAGTSTELTERCDRDGGALFTLAPPALDVLTGLADRGEMMPPKTTYFEPKPYAGIFLRS